MNNNHTIEELRMMRVGLMGTLDDQHIVDNRVVKMTADEYLAVLTDQQWEERVNNKIERLVIQAGSRERGSVAKPDYAHANNLDKNMFARLAALNIIKRKENILLTRASGTGKSYLVQAL